MFSYPVFRRRGALAQGICAAILAFSGAQPVRAQKYEAIILPADGFPQASACGVYHGRRAGGGYNADGIEHALLWMDGQARPIDLHPPGFDQSYVSAMTGLWQAGFGYDLGTAPEGFCNLHALLWKGRAESVIDLHPAGFHASYVYAMSEERQAGGGLFGQVPYYEHALLWAGGAASAVDLHPGGVWSDSCAYGVGGGLQVGYVSGPTTGGSPRAILWKGSAASAVSLHPAGAASSCAYATDGRQQVGSVWFANPNGVSLSRAFLWSGDKYSAVSLHPDGFTESCAYGVCAGRQVGCGYGPQTGNADHALLWTGGAGNVVDLHRLLPAGFIASQARGIDDRGDIVGFAATSASEIRAVLWRSVSGPGG